MQRAVSAVFQARDRSLILYFLQAFSATVSFSEIAAVFCLNCRPSCRYVKYSVDGNVDKNGRIWYDISKIIKGGIDI